MYKALQQSGAAPALSLLSGRFKMAVNAAAAIKAASNLRFLPAHHFMNPHAAAFTTCCRIRCLATVVGRATKSTHMEGMSGGSFVLVCAHEGRALQTTYGRTLQAL